jgi:hypothetical protein
MASPHKKKKKKKKEKKRKEKKTKKWGQSGPCIHGQLRMREKAKAKRKLKYVHKELWGSSVTSVLEFYVHHATSCSY